MEYLMTYSWAILVVMMVGIALWQLGIFNLGGRSGTTYVGFSRLKPHPPLTRVTIDGDITTVLTNGAGGSITIIDVNGSCTFSSSSETVDIGENFLINGTGCDVSGLQGDLYDVDMIITYNVTAMNLWVVHIEKGSLRGPLE